MKKLLAILLCAAVLLGLMAGCADNAQPTEPSANPSKPTESKPTEPSNPTQSNPTTPEDPWAAYECITIAEALALCEQFVQTPSADRYYIRATIKSVDNTTFGQMTIEDETGSIMVYGTQSADGSLRYDAMAEKPDAGDEVLLYGTLQNYKGNTKEVQNGWIIDFIGGSSEPSELPADGTELTIAEILALPVASGVTTTQHYIVKATVESISNATYGTMWITDGEKSISVYNSKNADGSVGYADMADKPYKGDSVTLKCTVQNFNGTMEIKQAYILEFTHNDVQINPADYAEMSIADARLTEKGTKVKVSGVVAQITYANGMIPSGVILVDNTSSIYVYDGDLAARCQIGNAITICASKTYWVLESEQGNADKFGYKGCNQLETATLLENDNKTNAFNTSWITESTVKDIIDTPVTTDITSLIFKVTAQIKEVPGNGFTNFYINDLDGATGSYSYSQCNGNDFTWLREFDGKICTVYLVALNAKSTSSDCFWRFLPVKVVDEGFDSASVNAAQLAVKYFGLPQFQTSYTGNPAMDLLSSADFDLLNIKGVKLSYASSDSSVISVNGNVMNCLKTGTAEITVTGEYGGKTYSEKITISVTIVQQEAQYDTIRDAIAAEVNTIVTVKGIVGPSLVNRTGFYLFNDDAMIAVVVSDAAILQTLEIGHEVVIEAKRDLFHNGAGDHAGQIALTDATVVTNFYGKHEYSTDFFINGKTLADVVGLDITQQHSTEVYVVKATVEFVETAYYTTLNISDNGVTLKLYMSGAGQYSWLKDFTGQEVTMEIAPCNWNNKKDEWRGCVLAVRLPDGTKVVNALNFQH